MTRFASSLVSSAQVTTAPSLQLLYACNYDRPPLDSICDGNDDDDDDDDYGNNDDPESVSLASCRQLP